MMAHDSGNTPPGRLDDTSIDALRASLRAARPVDPASCGELLTIAAEARARAILPEHLTLKEIWSGLPEVRSIRSPRAGDLLQRGHDVHQEYYSA